MREKIGVKDIGEERPLSRPASLPDTGSSNRDDFRNTMHAATGAFGEEKLVQFVVFNLGDEEFGVDIEQVSEIVRIGKFAPIPDSPGFIRGLTNVRGTIIAVIDLKVRFALQAREGVEDKHIIITREQKNLLGILVDEVTEVLRVAQKEIRPVPGATSVIHKKYMTGVITVGERMIILLDLKSVLSEEELEKLAQIRESTLEEKGHSLKKKLAVEAEEAGEEETEEKEAAGGKEAKEAEAKKAKNVKRKGGR